MSDTAPSVLVPLGHGLELHEARFVSRPNQFTLVLDMGGSLVRAAMADRGRLSWILTPNRTLLVEPRDGAHRKTAFQVLGALDDEGRVVSLDTQLPNRLVRAALEARAMDEFEGVASFAAEVRYGSSRFDFELTHDDGTCTVLEVKSVGRIDADGVARFPDAPTERGRRHVAKLIELATSPPAHTRCALSFIVQGAHASRLAVDEAIDPEFGEILRAAIGQGVLVTARACAVSRHGVALGPLLELHPREL